MLTITRRRLYQIILILADTFFIYLAIQLAWHIRFSSFVAFNRIEGSFLVIWILTLISHYIFDLYEPAYFKSNKSYFKKLFFSLVCISLVIFSIHYLVAEVGSHVMGRGVLAIYFAIYFLFSALIRYFITLWMRGIHKLNTWWVLEEKDIFNILQKEVLRQDIECNLIFKEQIDKNDIKNIQFKKIRGIILPYLAKKTKAEYLMKLKLKGLQVVSAEQFFESFFRKIPVELLSLSWLVRSEGFIFFSGNLRSRLKRLFDIMFSLTLILISWPLILVLWVLVSISSKGPGIFKQARVGQNAKTFMLYKFRSMTIDAEKDGAQWAKKNDQRVTLIGKFLRKSRLDELPQLVNILRGEMTFVGPRPERPEFTEMLKAKIPHYEMRQLVKPGLSGWAQVNYPYGASIEDAKRKLEYELYYIKNYSLFLDAIIILKTIKVVALGKGV